MALILKSNLYGNIKIHSNKIIGIMGSNYDSFINKINDNNSYIIKKSNSFYTNSVNSEMLINTNNKVAIEIVLKEFNLNYNFLNKNIGDLSNGEKRLLMYMIAFINNKKIIIIDEPFLDMDYNLKKKMMGLLKKIVYETNKTIIIGSSNSNIIYELCYSVLLLDKTYYYDRTVNIFSNSDLLNKYNIDVPEIVKFINLVKKKNILIDYSFDIRDLIKDVYKCV